MKELLLLFTGLIAMATNSSLVEATKSEEIRFGAVMITPMVVFFVGRALGAF